METISLQTGVVYGPVRSRRFGRSLGLNILPTERRVCTLNCVYCQYPDTPDPQPCHFPSLEKVESEVAERFTAIRDRAEEIDWVLFSGNGEPTLHPHFTGIVSSVLRLRDRLIPGTPVGILSNSSTSFLPRIRTALSLLDARFMKLDAGSLYMFKNVNRPLSTFLWGDVVFGLSLLPNIALQSMFVRGKVNNTDPRSVEDWIDAVDCIRPSEVQVYTVDRTPQEPGVEPVPFPRLQAIAAKLRATAQVPVSVYGTREDDRHETL
ncbi:MAG TPA: radical SAM protein [Candidatus Eisenbacteria bacterium]|jgi:wyosine [tRNA(Phe)-imidazoG37] synthetase (radical SAM superfamily)|nr:radical SAM protein [Candidatus Eisenbacteria bacterium]